MRQYKRAIAFVLILAAVIAIIPKNDSERKVEAAPAATQMPTVTTSPSPTPAGTPVSTIYPETGTIETAAPTMVPTEAPTATVTPAAEVTPVPTPVITPAPATEEIRGVWIAFYEYKKAGLKNKSEAVFRKNADKLFKKIKDNGCNAVFFHVRAFDDAIWPSENFKFSSYMGKKTPNYDPLAILVESAHKYGLKFHAWMNPYRITQKKIYNPAKKSTTSRIMLAVREVIDSYPVDGIHFDDYFYPGSGHKQYKKYASLSNKQKKANVNKMVQTVYGNIKAQNPKLLFGISPAGNVEYCESLGADVKTWMKGPGYVDYIVPQIYWSNSYRVGKKTVRMFDNRFAKWKRLNKGNIPMYIGLALYRGGMKDVSDRGWRKSKKIIASQISKIRRSEKAYGYILFSYESLYKKACRYEVKNMLARIARIKVTKVSTDGTTRLKTTVWPARLGQMVTWKSSNPSIASITNKGSIRVKQNGIVKFTVKKAGKSVSLKINTEDL